MVQTAAKLVLEPVFEADFEDGAYGYRPRRSGTDAIKEVHQLVCRGYTDVVDADLSKYFVTIPHSDLLKLVARRSTLATPSTPCTEANSRLFNDIG
ncbi:reverse transcriptase/maturase family protein [Mesorhizobium sp. M0494]